MKYIKKSYLKEIEVSELDLENVDNILGVNEDGHNYNYITNIDYNKHYWAGETQEIEIDKLIETVTKLKKSGANYVEILHHGDHHGYVFYGIEMRNATKEEVAKHLDDDKKSILIAKENKIKELEKELEKLKK